MRILQIIFLSLLIFGCASSDKLKQSTQQIEVDGMSDDWPQLDYFNKDLGIVYGVSYDNSHLYVIAKTYEENAKQRIVSSGLTVWIDANGKKKKNIGVKYPIMKGALGNGNRERNGGQKKTLEEDKLNSVMLQGIFSDEMQIVQKSNLNIDLDVEIKFDSMQDLVYEIKVPLALLKQNAKNDLKRIAIGFEVSGSARPIQGNGSPGGGRNRSGGGHSGGGGSPRGGRASGTHSESQIATSNKSLIFWYQVEL
ncbi:MAG: hypothetical protein WAU36_16715 [Cyclobacteriaceae bacterium]